jgi:RNA polymerase sigma factor (TIGR02999 family)
MDDLVQLIAPARAGNADAVNRLFDATYAELHRMAHQRLRRSAAITSLDTTALVHECYLRLAGREDLPPDDRSYLLCYAARAMRSIVVDLLRRRAAARHGGGLDRVTLDADGVSASAADEQDLLRVNDALEELAALDARLATVVEMKYFGGLGFEEIAAALGVNERTVRRDWQKARLVLASALEA